MHRKLLLISVSVVVGVLAFMVIYPQLQSVRSAGDRLMAPRETMSVERSLDEATAEKTVISRTFSGGASVKRPTKVFQPGLPKNNEQAAVQPPVDDDPFAAIDRKLASLPLGNIAFNTPKAVPYGDSAKIELLVSLQETEAQLKQAIRQAGPIETSSVHLSHRLEARLTGAGFEIETATPEIQALSRSQRTRWLWQIEPTKTETLDLHLTLSVLLTVDGEKMTRSVRTFERSIVVEVPLQSRIALFAENHFEWLLTGLLVPLLGALYRWRSRRQAKTISDDTPISPSKAA